MTIQTINGNTVIKAAEGYFLTNSNNVFGEEIYLGSNDSPENYQELPMSEYPTFQEESLTGEDPIIIDETNIEYLQYDMPMDLEKAKKKKISLIDEYDTSDMVNGFFYDGNLMWLDRETRSSLANTISSFEKVGRSELSIWYNDIYISLSIENAKSLLAMLEVYASDCYNVTAHHKQQVREMESIQEVINLDITQGYPQRLEF